MPVSDTGRAGDKKGQVKRETTMTRRRPRPFAFRYSRFLLSCRVRGPAPFSCSPIRLASAVCRALVVVFVSWGEGGERTGNRTGNRTGGWL